MAREAKRKGAVVIINQNGVAYPAWHGPGWEKANRPMQALLQLADYVIYQSEFCKIAADTFLGPVGVPWSIMHNPVDTRAFVPTVGAPPGMRILLAGSHHQFYRVRAAIEMLKHLPPYAPEVKLSIAGRYRWRKKEDDCLQEARQLATELDVTSHIEFIGAYTQAEAPSLFQQHHVLLHTQYNDSCPRLIVEAMACGLPVVYSASGGAPELVGNDAGVGVESRLDWETINVPLPQELAAATLKLFASFDRFSQAARKRAVEKFDRSVWIEKHQNIINSILKR
jgi:glycosyltransferase involved in cell wall biosynthesis